MDKRISNRCVLGLNLSGHDSSACIVQNGAVFAISLERLNRIKHSGPITGDGFEMHHAVNYLLNLENIAIEDIDSIVINSPEQEDWLKELASKRYPTHDVALLPQPSHHIAHAYSAFFTSPFKEAVVLVADTVGSYAPNKYARECETAFLFDRRNEPKIIKRNYRTPGEISAGWLYSFITALLGFGGSQIPFSGAGKTMGLAPYGKNRDDFPDFTDYYKENKNIPAVDFKNMLDAQGLLPKPIQEKELGINFPEHVKWRVDCRLPHEPITDLHKDLAYFAQKNIEDRVLCLIKDIEDKTKIKNLCLAGGTFLNSILNKKIMDKSSFQRIYVQPAATDDGCAIGCAMWGLLEKSDNSNKKEFFGMPYLGKEYSDKVIGAFLKDLNTSFHTRFICKEISPTKEPLKKIASALADGKICGFFTGRSEFGPRALGNRSLLADPRRRDMKDRLNKVKKRESFRPFAPTILRERVLEYFDIDVDKAVYLLPFMTVVANVRGDKKDLIPAVVHVDGTSRLQAITQKENERYYQLIKEFEDITGVPMVLNTSFNCQEPIVETPFDAMKTFLENDIDYLFLDPFLIIKNNPREIELL
ncbi:MAG: hypothetical protein MSIBF_06540 [Candidatus Altiarchaeales archaeon IMC4]|nr:MAG: hypothetical protein MSIBF_06540 [Candidatus Altiarchaeales archaeon IMC4]